MSATTAVHEVPFAMAARDPAALALALRDPRCYPHPADAVQLIETHISYVLLAGDFAYKLKKAVRLPFLDFSTAQAREQGCREELRLNRRTAPQLYLDVVPIGAGPRIGREPAIEYAVKMRRFPQEALFSSLAERGELEAAHVDALADAVVRFHAAAERVEARSGDAAAQAMAAADANFAEIAALEPLDEGGRLRALRAWTRERGEALAATFRARAAAGFTRDGHGDLHLANVVLLDGAPALFDCIEFSPELRAVDVVSDAAFAAMDLARHGLPRYAARFVNHYLERSGDYGGLAVLRFYQVYRAMVRAKVALLRAAQTGDGQARERALHEFDGYVELACRLRCASAPFMALMQGVSASGKTTVSERLLEAMGAIRLRSDVERKRLHGLDALARAAAAPGAGLYGARETADTYDRLADLAATALDAGYPVIVDATFLRRAERARFRAIAEARGAAFQIVACHAPMPVLRERVAAREAARDDASDAGLAVLQAQLALQEPLAGEELRHATTVDSTVGPDWKGAVESLARRFHRAG